jgi:hypothetical protein
MYALREVKTYLVRCVSCDDLERVTKPFTTEHFVCDACLDPDCENYGDYMDDP